MYLLEYIFRSFNDSLHIYIVHKNKIKEIYQLYQKVSFAAVTPNFVSHFSLKT